jgi:hypothetical protein
VHENRDADGNQRSVLSALVSLRSRALSPFSPNVAMAVDARTAIPNSSFSPGLVGNLISVISALPLRAKEYLFGLIRGSVSRGESLLLCSLLALLPVFWYTRRMAQKQTDNTGAAWFRMGESYGAYLPPAGRWAFFCFA